MWKRNKNSSSNQSTAPGWDALDQVLATYGFHDPMHLSTGHLPNQDGAYAINIYQTNDNYFLTTLGLSELFDKISDQPDTSGWGLELTMRVPRDEDEPPRWALNLLLKLSQYVHGQGRPLLPGHRLSPGGPITGSEGTRLTALAFAKDPVLPSVKTPNGNVTFVTVVGITRDELKLMKQTSTEEVLANLQEVGPLMVTLPTR